MPHRRQKRDERPARGARRQSERDRQPKDITGNAARKRAVVSTPPGRKSGPGRWVRLADVLPVGPVTEAELPAAAALVDFIRDREAA